MIILEVSVPFNKQLKKHAGIREDVKRKVDQLLENPMAGEPLKGNWRGYYSVPVKRNFIIIYLYCAACRTKQDSRTVNCPDCSETPDHTLRLVVLAPHDDAYSALGARLGN